MTEIDETDEMEEKREMCKAFPKLKKMDGYRKLVYGYFHKSKRLTLVPQDEFTLLVDGVYDGRRNAFLVIDGQWSEDGICYITVTHHPELTKVSLKDGEGRLTRTIERNPDGSWPKGFGKSPRGSENLKRWGYQE